MAVFQSPSAEEGPLGVGAVSYQGAGAVVCSCVITYTPVWLHTCMSVGPGVNCIDGCVSVPVSRGRAPQCWCCALPGSWPCRSKKKWRRSTTRGLRGQSLSCLFVFFSLLCGRVVNTFRTANKNFLFSPWHHQRPQTRNSRSRPVLSFLSFFCGSNCPNNQGLPVHGQYLLNTLSLLQCVWNKKAVSIDNLLPFKFRTQMVSPIWTILRKNLETICRVILAKTSYVIVNLLMMVLIIKFTCQHHISGYVCHVWHQGIFFLLLIEIILL